MTAQAQTTAPVFHGYVEVHMFNYALGKLCKRIKDAGGNSGKPQGSSQRFLKIPTTPAGLEILREVIQEYRPSCLVPRPATGYDGGYHHLHPNKLEREAMLPALDRWLTEVTEKTRRYDAKRALEAAAVVEKQDQKRCAAREEFLLTLSVSDVAAKLNRLAATLETHELEYLTQILTRTEA